MTLSKAGSAFEVPWIVRAWDLGSGQGTERSSPERVSAAKPVRSQVWV